MGVVNNIGYDVFPKQGSFLNETVEVCFRYDTSKTILGTVVRDDLESPWVLIIKLSDGRYVLSNECQYSPVEQNIVTE